MFSVKRMLGREEPMRDKVTPLRRNQDDVPTQPHRPPPPHPFDLIGASTAREMTYETNFATDLTGRLMAMPKPSRERVMETVNHLLKMYEQDEQKPEHPEGAPV